MLCLASCEAMLGVRGTGLEYGVVRRRLCLHFRLLRKTGLGFEILITLKKRGIPFRSNASHAKRCTVEAARSIYYARC